MALGRSRANKPVGTARGKGKEPDYSKGRGGAYYGPNETATSKEDEKRGVPGNRKR